MGEECIDDVTARHKFFTSGELPILFALIKDALPGQYTFNNYKRQRMQIKTVLFIGHAVHLGET